MHLRVTTVLRIATLALLITGLCAIVQAQTLAYVANSNLHNVSVINTATNGIVATIPVGQMPTEVLASPDGSYVYVLNTTPNFTVSVIDTALNAVVATIPTPGAGFFGAMSTDGSRIYISDPLFPGTGVNVIDTVSNSIVANIPLAAGSRPRGVSVSPDGTRLYIADLASPNVYIADTATNTVIDSIVMPSGGGTTALIVSRDGSRLYVGNGATIGDVGVFDTATKTMLASFPAGVGTVAEFTITPDNARIYAMGIVDGGPYLTIDTATLAHATHAPIDAAWVEAAFTPDSAFAYITDYLHSTVAVIKNATDALVANIPLPGTRPNPRGIVITTLPVTTTFLSFDVTTLDLKTKSFQEIGTFTLSSGSTIDPVTQPVTFTIGSYIVMIPAGSFHATAGLHWKFDGQLGDVKLVVQIEQHLTSTTQFDFKITGNGPNLTGLPRPINAGLKIGNKMGHTLVP